MKLIHKLSTLLLASLLIFTFGSCEKEPIIQTEIVTVIDTVLINTVDTILINIIDTVVVENDEEVTTFILIRHAEILDDSNDPGLTEEGIARTERLIEMLSVLDLDRVYTTNFNRTTQTALPVAESQDLALSTYGGFDHNFVIDDILDNEKGGIVFIVGHANTTPNFLNALSGTTDYNQIAEDVFDNFYIVNTRSKGDSEVVHLKY